MTTSVPTCRRVSKPAPQPARGVVRLLARKGSLPGQPDAAEIKINDTAYLCRCIPGGYELLKACGPKDAEPEVYHIDAELVACDCPDATYRGRRCKHQMALYTLMVCGKL